MNTLLTLDRELARELVAAARASSSGLVTCTRGKLKRLFCVERGELSFAVSNVLEEQFSEHLARSNRVAADTLVTATALLGGKREQKLSSWLVERGHVTPEDMAAARAEHVRVLLFDTLDWMDGECAFERGQPAIAGESTARVSIPAVLHDYARERPPSLELVRMRIGPPNVCPVPSAGATALLASIVTDAAVTRVIGLSNGLRSVGEIVDGAGPAEAEAWRTLYGLVLAGVLEPEPHKAQHVKDKDAVTREEVLARLERAEGADHYTILEQMPTAGSDEIRDAYYFLARRYHPDRFRTGPLTDMLPRMETYFTQVTEAYNTLSDAELRRAYDEQKTDVSRPKRTEQNTRELARQNYAHAKLLIDRGRYTDAVTSLENAVKQDASIATYQLELGRLLARNPRRRDDARAYLEAANRIDPALVDGYLALGDLELKAGRKAEALSLFREVLRWEPGHLEATERLEQIDEGGGRRGLFGG